MRLIFLLLVGVAGGLIAAIIAYLITYNEYQHHFKGKRVFLESIKSAVIAFLFFFFLIVILEFMLAKNKM
ncbi:hypothetical protein A3860_34535 [Niastella vici]|uniref:Uncharacterized protein n=1 Tax=Niastella vici TaxID=1703345 RepID=A0A1V9FPG8_9BACT|nr:hypothetical protein A3860_34535 [Niastella vici]